MIVTLHFKYALSIKLRKIAYHQENILYWNKYFICIYSYHHAVLTLWYNESSWWCFMCYINLALLDILRDNLFLDAWKDLIFNSFLPLVPHFLPPSSFLPPFLSSFLLFFLCICADSYSCLLWHWPPARETHARVTCKVS